MAEIRGPKGFESFVFLKRAKQIGFLPMLMELQKTYGDWVVVSSPTGQKIYIVNSASGIEEILHDQASKFIKGKAIEVFKLLIGNGLPVAEGEKWRSQRRLVQPSFHRISIEGYAPVMHQTTVEHAERWASAETSTHEADGSLNAARAIAQLTHDIIARTMFGADLGDSLGELQAAWTEALEFIVDRSMKIVKLPLWVPSKSNLNYKRAMALVSGTVDSIVQKRVSQKDSSERQDLLQRLLVARDSEKDGKQLMTDREVRDQILAFLFAGHETTASNIGFTLWRILGDPSIEAKVRAEIDEALGGSPATYDQLPKLAYLRKVIYEALRLYPPASMFVRQSIEDVEISGHLLKKGSIFILTPYVVHRNPELWSNPETFDPERFASPPNQPVARFFSFGAGPRVCIGEQFAIAEAQIVIATLLQKLDFELLSSPPVGELFRGTLQPSVLPVRVSARQ